MAEANAEQRVRWNEVIAPRWVTVSDEIDAELVEVTELALAHAAPRPGEAVLEIGCGTGPMTLRLSRAVLPLGWVLALDFSPVMLRHAANNFRRTSRSNVRFQLADAQTEGLKAGLFDLAFSRFGVMFFDDPKAAFANIRRAMKPTGRLSFVCWGPLERNPHWAIPRAIAARHLGVSEPTKPRSPGPMALADPEYLRSTLEGAGWREVAVEEKTPMFVRKPMERAVRFTMTIGPTESLIREHNPSDEVVAKIAAEIREAFAPYEHGGEVRIPGSIFLVGAKA